MEICELSLSGVMFTWFVAIMSCLPTGHDSCIIHFNVLINVWSRWLGGPLQTEAEWATHCGFHAVLIWHHSLPHLNYQSQILLPLPWLHPFPWLYPNADISMGHTPSQLPKGTVSFPCCYFVYPAAAPHSPIFSLFNFIPCTWHTTFLVFCYIWLWTWFTVRMLQNKL